MLSKYSMCMGYGHVLIYVVACHITMLECFYMSITCCVVPNFICAVIASAVVPHPGPVVLLCGSTAAMER